MYADFLLLRTRPISATSDLSPDDLVEALSSDTCSWFGCMWKAVRLRREEFFWGRVGGGSIRVSAGISPWHNSWEPSLRLKVRRAESGGDPGAGAVLEGRIGDHPGLILITAFWLLGALITIGIGVGMMLAGVVGETPEAVSEAAPSTILTGVGLLGLLVSFVWVFREVNSAGEQRLVGLLAQYARIDSDEPYLATRPSVGLADAAYQSGH